MYTVCICKYIYLLLYIYIFIYIYIYIYLFYILYIMYIYILNIYYIYIFLYLPVLLNSSSLSFLLSAALVVQPASSQDLLWVAGRSSLTSLTRPAWLGYVRLSDMHPFGYTPRGTLPRPHSKPGIDFVSWKSKTMLFWIKILEPK